MSLSKIKKKAEFDFVWIFSIIAGGAILLLAIYGATRGGDTLRYQQETQLARSLSVVLKDLQAGTSDSSTYPISFKQNTRIITTCSEFEFGTNEISTATESTIGKKWSTQRGAITIKDLYLFSSEQEGKNFEILSRPFNYPFKVGDLLFLSSEKYCLPNVPSELKSEINSLGLSNWQIGNCSEADNMKTICFGSSSSCDIKVIGTCSAGCKTKYDEGYVEKDRERFYYVGSLMYGAIFSDKDLYDCNVERLIYRATQLSGILAEKANIMDSAGCPTSLGPFLTIWESTLNKTVPDSIVQKNDYAKTLDQKQNGINGGTSQACKVW